MYYSKCCIIDDCKADALEIYKYITSKTDWEIDIVESYDSSKQYHYYFIDIELENANGIVLAKQIISKEHNAKIIIVSNHNNMVFDSLVVQPYFFIRKDELKKDIDRLLDLINKHTIMIKGVNIENVAFVEVITHDLYLHYIDGVIIKFRYTLKQFIEDCNGMFCQTHKSFAINLNCIKQINKDSCELFNQQVIPVSSVYYVNLIEGLENYL